MTKTTKKEDKIIPYYFEKHLPICEIARALQIPDRTVRNVLKRYDSCYRQYGLRESKKRFTLTPLTTDPRWIQDQRKLPLRTPLFNLKTLVAQKNTVEQPISSIQTEDNCNINHPYDPSAYSNLLFLNSELQRLTGENNLLNQRNRHLMEDQIRQGDRIQELTRTKEQQQHLIHTLTRDIKRANRELEYERRKNSIIQKDYEHTKDKLEQEIREILEQKNQENTTLNQEINRLKDELQLKENEFLKKTIESFGEPPITTQPSSLKIRPDLSIMSPQETDSEKQENTSSAGDDLPLYGLMAITELLKHIWGNNNNTSIPTSSQKPGYRTHTQENTYIDPQDTPIQIGWAGCPGISYPYLLQKTIDTTVSTTANVPHTNTTDYPEKNQTPLPHDTSKTNNITISNTLDANDTKPSYNPSHLIPTEENTSPNNNPLKTKNTDEQR